MASSGQLCTVIARLLGLPEPTLRLHFLNMARAGLRTTGGRGRSAAKMVARDAATLIVAGQLARPSRTPSRRLLNTPTFIPPWEG